MKNMHAQAAGILGLGGRQQGRKLDPARRHAGFKSIEDIVVCACVAIAIEQPQVRQHIPVEEFLLCNNVERPAASGRELPGYGQLALNLRSREPIRWLHFHQALGTVRHFHEEVRNDVAALAAVAALGV